MRMSIFWMPARVLVVAVAIGLAALLAATWYAHAQPWLGLHLAATAGEPATPPTVLGVAAKSPAAGRIPPGSQLLAVDGIALRGDDMIEEPDLFHTYEEMAGFFARQEALAQALRQPQVTLRWRDGDREDAVSLAPTLRPLGDLPGVFWFQALAGVACCLIGAWVFALRPAEWSTRLFATTGLMFLLSIGSAAVYSTRELALPGAVFRGLSALNHAGSLFFGGALIGVFLCYPRALVHPRTLLWLPAVFVPWWLADSFRWMPDQDWGSRIPILTALLLIVACALMQWRRSRGHALDRAALRWLALSVVTGCGLFAFSMMGSRVLGLMPPLSQGYAFGFFLIMYIGIALGLGRYRLFQLDEWAYRVLLWVVGALAVLLFDAVVLLFFGLSPAWSLGIALLACGWLYFPLRQWLWDRLVRARHPRLEELLPDLLRIAYSGRPAEKDVLWEQLLRRLYDPLEILHDPAPEAPRARVGEGGLQLSVPARGGLPARRMRYGGRGARLFSIGDAKFVDALGQLMDEAAAGRQAHERGAAEERRRIARDMHDDIGARLLMLIHRASDPRDAEIARAAMQDLRTALHALESEAVVLGDALADWRADIDARCESAGVAMCWTQAVAEDTPLTSREKATLERVLREAVTNALKHAAPSTLCIAVEQPTPARLHIEVSDDGTGMASGAWSPGRGLRNMRQRMAEMGGDIAFASADGAGGRILVRLPLSGVPA